MESEFKKVIKNVSLICLVFISLFTFGCGCNTSKPASDPLAGWKMELLEEPNSILKKDRDDFVENLSPKGKKITGPSWYYTDGKGQHAVTVEVFVGGTASWSYILIYNKEGQRVKVIKYHYTKYQS
jgi:hypothetical protein